MDDDDKSSAVSGWATPNSVGLAVERYQLTDRGKDLVSLTKEADMCWPVKVAGQMFFSSVWGAERAGFRRLISLIFAGWLPHDNRFVGELPCSNVEGHSVAGCLLASSRVLLPWSVLLPTHCVFLPVPYARVAGCGSACPIAQTNPANSRAMAIQT
jgi:hypothetical protein